MALTDFFLDSEKNPKWGPILGTLATTAIGAIGGIFFGESTLAILIGSLVGLAGGAAMNGAFSDKGNPSGNTLDNKRLNYSTSPAPSPQASKSVTLDISEAGKTTSRKVAVNVPNIEYYQAELKKMENFSVPALATENYRIARLPKDSPELEGAIKIANDRHGVVKDFVANINKWNDDADKWNSIRGSLNGAPVAQRIEIKASEIPKELREYVQRIYVADGKSTDSFNKISPAERLMYAADSLDKIAPPDWTKAGRILSGPGGGDRDTTTTWVRSIRGVFGYKSVYSQTDTIAEYNDAFAKGNYDEAIHFAKVGKHIAQKGERGYLGGGGLIGVRLGKNDTDAVKEFDAAINYAQAMKHRAILTPALKEYYNSIDNARHEVETKFQAFAQGIGKMQQDANASRQIKPTNTSAAEKPAEKPILTPMPEQGAIFDGIKNKVSDAVKNVSLQITQTDGTASIRHNAPQIKSSEDKKLPGTGAVIS